MESSSLKAQNTFFSTWDHTFFHEGAFFYSPVWRMLGSGIGSIEETPAPLSPSPLAKFPGWRVEEQQLNLTCSRENKYEPVYRFATVRTYFPFQPYFQSIHSFLINELSLLQP